MGSKHTGIRTRALACALSAIAFVGGSSSAMANAVTYFINNQPGSNCSDAGPHTESQPWCTFTPINQVAVLSPGDQVLLARGSNWDEQLTLAGSGTASAPITLGAYGSGPNPRIMRDQATGDLCVLLTDAGHWHIEHLEVGNASVGILLHYTGILHEDIAINDIYAHDNKGIWSRYSPQFPVSGGVADPFASALNINLSAGILFNISPSLSFSSSQYVLKEVSLSNVRGSHNLDSVAFDAEVNTIDGQDGHNAFQNVVLNGLILTDDDGNAASEYQSAGLGCSDALRLVGMTNVTLLDSVLYDEAACYTPSGTAAVLLGRVQNVTLVNNIIFGVPATGSPDETGLDLEYSESQVSLLANLFAENAGPGVEILDIHQSDRTDAVNLVDNSFLNNARAHTGAASIWQENGGSDDAIPSGLIEGSLFNESAGPFFDGNQSGAITQINNTATSSFPSYAAQQFSSTQGLTGWHCMYQNPIGTWVDMPTYSPSDYNGAWEVSPAQYVSAFALAPASGSPDSAAGGVARVWIAPVDGQVDVRGQILKSDPQGGSGVYAQVSLVSRRAVTPLWPESGWQFLAGTDAIGYATDLSAITVHAGDMVRFAVTANGPNLYDTVSWTPSVAYVSAPRPRAETGSHPGVAKSTFDRSTASAAPGIMRNRPRAYPLPVRSSFKMMPRPPQRDDQYTSFR